MRTSHAFFVAGEARERPLRAAVIAPWDGASLGECSLAGWDDLDDALAAAQSVFARTTRLPTYVRQAFLRALAARVRDDREGLAETMAREAAKPITFARAEADRAVLTLTLAAEEAGRWGGSFVPLDHLPSTTGAAAVVTRTASGPVLAITPFNFPLNLVLHKLAPAFALGAPVVLKPAPQAPLTALRLAGHVYAACEAVPEVPKAILSVVPCAVKDAQRMVDDPRPAVLSFTGSAKVGWALRARAGSKRVLLELGGNAAAIVLPDADMDVALARIVTGAYGYAGQVCIKVQRVLVHADVAARFTDGLVARSAAVEPVDPMRPEALMSCLIDAAAGDRVRQWVGEAVAAGARVLLGGGGEGNRVAATVLAGAGPGMKVYDEEVFGPVVTVETFNQLDEAVGRVNAGRYGLQAGIFTRDLGAVMAAYRGLDVGGLVVGDAPTFRADAMPYGGAKDSGLGREGVRSAMEEMSEARTLVLRSFFA